jgi:hypothetical protein
MTTAEAAISLRWSIWCALGSAGYEFGPGAADPSHCAREQMSTLDPLAAALEEVLASEVLFVALRQRAKFEGWLKIELAHKLHARDLRVSVEREFCHCAGGKCRADLSIGDDDGRERLVMLKTLNTNFRFEGVRSSSRPITKNVAGVAEDIIKLRGCELPCQLTACSVFFPVSANGEARSAQLGLYLDRITDAGCRLTTSHYCARTSDWGIAFQLFDVVAPVPTPV